MLLAAVFGGKRGGGSHTSYLFGVHTDRHLAVQVAFGDHVGTAGVDHSGRLQGLQKPPADRFVPVPPRHLLQWAK